MTPEERLRELLREEAELLVPAGDGLERIRRRVAERRSPWRVLRPVVGLAAALAVVVGGAIGTTATDRVDTTAREVETERPEPRETTEPEGCVGGGDVLCAEDGPLPPVPTTSGITTSAPGTPFWPFTSDREAASWARDPGSRAWAADPQQVAQRLVDEHLDLQGVTAAPGRDEVELRVGSSVVGVVELVQVGVGGSAAVPWSVVAVRPGPDSVLVLEPTPGQRVASPIAVSGLSDAAVALQLRASAGTVLGSTTATPGSDRTFTEALDWSALSWSTGSVSAVLREGASVTSLAVVAVRRAGAAGPGVPPAASTFLAVDRGAVVLHDAMTGQRLRQLSYPPEGAVDSDPSRGGDGAVFLRRRAGRCADELVRVSLGNGSAGVTVPGGRQLRESPAVSPDGRLLAWVERPCRDGVATGGGDLVVRGPDARERRLPLFSERIDLTGLRHLAIRDDGTLLFEKPEGGVSVLAGTASSVDASTSVGDAPDCPDTAPAWSGRDLVLWRGCQGSQVGLLLQAPDYGNGLQPPSLPVDGVLSTSVAQAESGPQLLVALGRPDAVGPVARVVDGRLVTLFANDGCGGTTGPCLTDPTW